MSTKKDWKVRHIQLNRKEQRSIYLTQGDWEYLMKEGKGIPSHTIREMINLRRESDSQKIN